MTPKWLHSGADIPVRVYIDRRIEDLQRYHDLAAADLQAEIDRRIASALRETTTTATAFEKRMEALTARLDRAESALDRQRGRVAVYTGLAATFGVIIALATLIINHVRL